jgi:hypothetical protein
MLWLDTNYSPRYGERDQRRNSQKLCDTCRICRSQVQQKHTARAAEGFEEGPRDGHCFHPFSTSLSYRVVGGQSAGQKSRAQLERLRILNMQRRIDDLSQPFTVGAVRTLLLVSALEIDRIHAIHHLLSFFAFYSVMTDVLLSH